MISSFFSALLAALPAGGPPVPPPVVTSPPAPPAFPMSSPPPMIVVPDQGANRQPSIFEIQVGAGAAPFWSGTVRAAYGRAASFRQWIDQAAPGDCPRQLGETQMSQRLEVSVMPASYGIAARADRFMVQATWSRPVSPGSCPDLGSRTVQVQRIVTLRAGETIEVEGDAGLRVRLHRTG